MLENYGITVAWQGITVDGLTAIATEADKLGFGYIWVPEAWGLEAFSVISHILCKTKSIRVGTGITNVYSRSAALIGMGCATFDQIAPGRFMLGLGSSGKGLIENWHGNDFSKPLRRTEEYVQVIRKVAKGDPIDFDGEVLKHLSKFRLFTRPIESKLEIYLGAIGDANLKLAGKICEGAILAGYPSTKLDHALECLKEGSQGANKKLLTYLPSFISNSGENLLKASEQIAKNIAFYITSMGTFYPKNLVRLGYEDEVNNIVEANKQGGSKASVQALRERIFDELSLVGRPQSILERVSKFPHGAIPVLGFGARSSEEIAGAIESMRTLSREG